MKPEITKQLDETLRRKLQALPEFAVEYIFSLEYKDTELRTRVEYAKDVKLFFDFLIESGKADGNSAMDITPSSLSKLQERDIRDYFSYLTSYTRTYHSSTGKKVVQSYTNSNQGKARKRAAIFRFFEHLVDHDQLNKNIVRNVKIRINKEVSMKSRLTEEDIKNYFAAIVDDRGELTDREKVYQTKLKERNYVIALLFSYTGIRVSELVQLDIDDISVKHEQMIVTRKSGKQEAIKLPSSILEDIREYIITREKLNVPTNALFVSLHKKRMNPKSVANLLEKYQQRAGIDIKVTPHTFRRTFGTRHYNKYRDMYLTAEIMGHETADTTKKFYANASEKRKDQSMEDFDYGSDSPSSSPTLNMEKIEKLAEKLGVSVEDLMK